MEVDSASKYLATGDVNGIVKVWNIADYCLDIIDFDHLIEDERKELETKLLFILLFNLIQFYYSSINLHDSVT